MEISNGETRLDKIKEFPNINARWESWTEAEKVKLAELEGFLQGLFEVITKQSLLTRNQDYLQKKIALKKAVATDLVEDHLPKSDLAVSMLNLDPPKVRAAQNSLNDSAFEFQHRFNQHLRKNVIYLRRNEFTNIANLIKAFYEESGLGKLKLDLGRILSNSGKNPTDGKLGFNPQDLFQIISSIFEKIQLIKSPQRKLRVKAKGL
jgi:hypothetical protein